MIPEPIRVAVAVISDEGRQDLAEAVAAPMVAAAHLCLASALAELRSLYDLETAGVRRVSIIIAARSLIRKWWLAPSAIEVNMEWVDVAMAEIAGNDEINEDRALGWSWRDYARGQWGGSK